MTSSKLFRTEGECCPAASMRTTGPLPFLLCRVSAPMAPPLTRTLAALPAPRWRSSRLRRESRCPPCPRWSTGVPMWRPIPGPRASSCWRRMPTCGPDRASSARDSPWAGELRGGVGAGGASHETGVAVSSVRHGNARPASWASALGSPDTDRGVLGVLKNTPAQLEQLRSSGIPLVVVDPANPPPPEIPSVGATNWAGGLAATEHLLSLGHRRIAAIGGPEDYLCSRARVDGYRSALERAGIAFDLRLVRDGDFQPEGGFVGGGELLDLADRPTAIFAGNDQHALGVYEAARQRSLRIPQDLSVVGFDDLPVARWVSPPLTPVRQPLAEMGRAAAQMLGELIEDRPLRSKRVELSTELITRESTGPLEAAR